MPGDSSDIDNAIVAKLGADATLLSYATNGVYMDEGPANAPRIVIVSLADHHDEPKHGGTAFEDAEYLIEVWILSTTANANAISKAAAARVHALLDGQPLVAAGFNLMVMQRVGRTRDTDRDEVDPSILWYRRGGRYQVLMSPV